MKKFEILLNFAEKGYQISCKFRFQYNKSRSKQSVDPLFCSFSNKIYNL